MNTNTNPNSRVLHMAHILKANRPDFQWSDMVRYAWYLHHFRETLKAGVVTFSFFKEDGSIREAKGTLNGVLIPAEDLPKRGADNSSLPARRDQESLALLLHHPFHRLRHLLQTRAMQPKRK